MSFDQLQRALEARSRDSLYRQRQVIASPQQPQLIANGEPVLGFCANDYLGLAADPRVISAFQAAADEYGVGGGASHLVCGHSHYHHALEEALAEFTGRPRALLFSSGYMANIGVINALLDKSDAVFQDRLNHASLLDGGLLCGARFQRYAHADSQALELRLARSEARRKLVVTDGVFSMDGDIAPLDELQQVAERHGAWLMVDDAHGFGVLGETGAGCAEAFACPSDKPQVLVGTLGKAFGTSGAFVAGSEVLIETLIQFARSYIYTTSMPPAVAAATLCSLQIIRDELWRRQHLAGLIKRFRRGCEQLGLTLMDSSTPIQPILVGESQRAVAMSQALARQGVMVSAIRPPTVPEGAARLRVTLSASHTEQQVDRLLEALANVDKEVANEPSS